jgi:hypothetical protein
MSRRRARDESDEDEDGNEEVISHRSKAKRGVDDDEPSRRSRSKRGGDDDDSDDDDDVDGRKTKKGFKSSRKKKKKNSDNESDGDSNDEETKAKPKTDRSDRPTMKELAAGKPAHLDAGRPFGQQIPKVWNTTWQGLSLSSSRSGSVHIDFLEAGRQSMLKAEGALFQLRDDDDQSIQFWKRLTQGSTALQFIFGILALQVLCLFKRSCIRNKEDPTVPENAEIVPIVTLVLMLVLAPLGYMGAASRSKLALAAHAFLALVAVVSLLAAAIIAFESGKDGRQMAALRNDTSWEILDERVKMSFDWNGSKDAALKDLRSNLQTIGGMAIGGMLLNLFSMVGAMSLLAIAPGSLGAELAIILPCCARRAKARGRGGAVGTCARCWRASRGCVFF